MGTVIFPRRDLFAVSLIAIGLSGCHRPAPPTAAPAAGPASVTVAPVEVREMTLTEDFSARVEATESVEIRPRVSGYITEIRFQAGQMVRPGDVLFVINPRPLETALQLAEANLQKAKVAAEISAREAERGAQLLTAKTISPEEYETRKWRAQDAAATVLANEASRHSAQITLDYCQVKSPISGRISRALVTVGNNASGVEGFTTLLATVVTVDPVHVYAAMEDGSLLNFRKLEREGKLEKTADGRIAVDLQIADGEGFAHHGTIEHFDNRLDPNTGTIVLRSTFPNADGILLPGLYARLRVPSTARKPVMLIPELAVGTEQSLRYVWTLSSSNTAQKTFITLGPTLGGKRIVERGLVAADRVVINGLQRIMFPGMPLAPEAPASPVPGPAKTP